MQSSAHVIVVVMAEGKKTRTEIKASKAAARNPRWTTVFLLVGIVISIGVAVAVGYLFEKQLVVWIIRGTAGLIVLSFVLSFLIRLGYRYEWTGFGQADLPKPEDREVRPKKTVWDWMQLLIVPVVLALVTVTFTLYQEGRQTQVEEQRAASERKTQEQRAQDAALQAYLDQMSTLLLEEKLRNSEETSEVRTLARARALTVLGRLDPSRKTAVMQFLVDADLVQSIDERDPIVSLKGADLSGADVSDANLRNADLREANLSDANLSDSDLGDSDLSLAALANADLSFANLRGAYLSDANLSFANLTGAYLSDANLSFANLTGANLSDAYLRGANLSGVDLRGTKEDGAADKAILTFRQCIEAEAPTGAPAIEERIYEIIPQMPEEIRLGETVRAGLLVSPLTINEVNESDPGCVEPADRMQAQLVPLDLEKQVISAQHASSIRELSSNRVTRWGWEITARQTGKLELILDLRYAISPEGQKFRQVPQSPVYEGAIRVTTE